MVKKIFLPGLMAIGLAAVVGLQPPAPAHGFANSAPSFACMSCHSGTMATDMVSLGNLPANYRPGQTYNLTLTLQSALESLGEQQGGFALQVSAGELMVSDQTNTQISDGILTHTLEGSQRRTWDFAWQAPGTAPAGGQPERQAEPGPIVSITVMGVAANGDYSSVGDEVGAASFTLQPQP